VEAASRTFFGKPARRLTDSEAALLAATLPSPLQANPALRVGRIRWRQNLILRRMHGEAIVVPPAEALESLPPLPDSLRIDN
jgi:membrane peptidoglycan carboxypeptidase